ncbi:MAG: glycosyl hydrolase family 18 protein [Candidatus Dormibacterales bacterium]
MPSTRPHHMPQPRFPQPRRLLACAAAAAGLTLLAAPARAQAAGAPASQDLATHPRIMQEVAAQVAHAPLARSAPARSAAPAGGGAVARAPVGAGPKRQVYGFALASSLGDATYGYPSWNYGALSTAAFFGLDVSSLGHFVNDSGWQTWNSGTTSAFVGFAHSRGTKVDVTIVLQDFSSNQQGNPGMCPGLVNAGATVNDVVSEVRAKGVDGVNVDYEGLNAGCGNGATTRSMFVGFVKALRAALGPGPDLVVDTYGSSAADPSGFFDIPSLTPYVSAFFVMAYDMDYSNWSGPPLYCNSPCMNPVAPLTTYHYNDTSIAAQYSSAAGAGKVLLGVPYYGRTDCVGAPYPNWYPTKTPDQVSPTYLDSISTPGTPGVSSYKNSRDTRDAAGQEPWSTWQSSTYGCTRESYWDDTVSLGRKYDLVNHDQLAGVGIWALNFGGGDPGLWTALVGHFTNLPGAPGGVAADGGDGQATVSWTPPTVDTGGPVTSYTITSSAGTSMTVAGGVHGALFTGLTDGTAYTFTVFATNSSGDGPLSSASNSVTPSTAPRHRGYFAEGTTRPGFQEYLTVLNQGAGATATVTYLFADGTPAAFQALVLPAHSRTTVDVNRVMGPGRDVSAFVDSASATLLAERPLYFDACPAAFCVNGGDVAGEAQPATSWDFAEGTTRPGFQEYLTVADPGPVSAGLTVRYLFPGGATLSRSYSVVPYSRLTVDVNREVGAGRDVSIELSSSVPVVAERPVYFRTCAVGACVDGGDVASGGQPGSAWQFAEGTTRPGFQEYLTVLNPASQPASVTLRYFYAPGQSGPPQQTFSVPPGRFTVHVNASAGTGKDVAISLTSSVPVVAERPMYFRTCAVGLCADGGTDAPGSPEALSWDFAEGYTGPGFAEYLSLLNPGSQAVSATIVYVYSDGSTRSLQSWVGAGSRLTVNVDATAGAGREVSALVTATAPIVAERPIYFDACFGLFCANGGTDAAGATSLP